MYTLGFFPESDIQMGNLLVEFSLVFFRAFTQMRCEWVKEVYKNDVDIDIAILLSTEARVEHVEEM